MKINRNFFSREFLRNKMSFVGRLLQINFILLVITESELILENFLEVCGRVSWKEKYLK